ncbi:hypothetical protein [Streptomyces sp. NPDC056883]|uniref:hypothetical protein n=1 Tax=Streptomyces sp. NPDC056883 TaxID=3345959 RepID=UPI0036856B4D
MLRDHWREFRNDTFLLTVSAATATPFAVAPLLHGELPAPGPSVMALAFAIAAVRAHRRRTGPSIYS